MIATSRTAAPRSSVVHAIGSDYASFTRCGRRIGDDWQGEYTEAPTGPVSCKRCAANPETIAEAAEEYAAELAQREADAAEYAHLQPSVWLSPTSVTHSETIAPSGEVTTTCGRSIPATWTETNGTVSCPDCETAAETEPAAPVFATGDRVGILTGLLAVGGPSIGSHGTVQRQVEFWRNTPEYVVATDDGEELVYRPYLLTGIHCDDCSANVAACVCDRDLNALLTGDPWHVPGTPFPALESEHAEALAMHAEYLTEVEYRARLLASGRSAASAARAGFRRARGYREGMALVAGDDTAVKYARRMYHVELRMASALLWSARQRIAYASRPITL